MTRLLINVNIPRFFYTHRLPLTRAALDFGYDVHITTSDADKEYVEKIFATGIPYHPLPLAQHGTNLLGEANTLRATVQLYRHLRPDIVHQISIKPIIYGGIAARLSGVKAIVNAMSGLGYIYSSNDRRARLLRPPAALALRTVLRGDNVRMIFQNPDDRAIFTGMRLLPEQRTVLIRGSGVDMAQFTPTPEPEGKPVVLFASRLMWQKGIGYFVEAARRLHERGRFVVCGFAESTHPGTVSPAQMQAWADEGFLEWWGRRDDMPEVFAQSHIVCLPSTYGEGVPKVLIEAAACGRPLVATDIPGCREIVRHDENGLLVPSEDTDALVAALTRLMDDRETRQRMGQRGRTIAETEFSLAQVNAATLALYHEMLQSETRRVIE